MIDLVPARPWMLDSIIIQPAQRSITGELSRDDMKKALNAGVSLACMRGDTVLAIGGVAPVWEDRGVVWGLLSSSIHATMPAIHRIVVRGLEHCTFKRVEAQVAVDHEEGHRWMKMLGFEREGTMRSFWKGQDFALYSRIRK